MTAHLVNLQQWMPTLSAVKLPASETPYKQISVVTSLRHNFNKLDSSFKQRTSRDRRHAEARISLLPRSAWMDKKRQNLRELRIHNNLFRNGLYNSDNLQYSYTRLVVVACWLSLADGGGERGLAHRLSTDQMDRNFVPEDMDSWYFVYTFSDFFSSLSLSKIIIYPFSFLSLSCDSGSIFVLTPSYVSAIM